MAFPSRLLYRSKQLYASVAIFPQERAIPVRYFAKKADPPAFKGDEMLKSIFLDVKKKFETAIGILKEEKITIDPADPAAVSQYAKVMKTVRKKAELMMDALEKVENEIKKPLMRDDKKKMALLKAEFEEINKKLGIRKEDLPKYEEQLELKIAKAQPEELKKDDLLEAMESYWEKFKDEEMPDVKSLE